MFSLRKLLSDLINSYKSINSKVNTIDTKVNHVGAFTITEAPAKAISVKTITTVVSKQLPAGTYVISAALGWAIGNSSLSTAEYIAIDDVIQLAGYRPNMVSGGPYTSITGCVKLTETSTINIKQFWNGGSGTANNLAPVLYTLRIS